MVRAILEDRKTQTRRTVNPQPSPVEYYLHGEISDSRNGLPSFRDEAGKGWASCGPFRCPYIAEGMYAGEKGILGNSLTDDQSERHSRLWVREAFYQFGHWEPVTGKKERTRTGRQRWKFVPDSQEIVFTPPHADFRKGRHSKDPETKAWHKRLGRFMPRKASRITLEVTAVRVERLQDISEEDALAEGLTEWQGMWGWPEDTQARWSRDPVAAYRCLWESINGSGSWDANPWVWVVEFRRVE